MTYLDAKTGRPKGKKKLEMKMKMKMKTKKNVPSVRNYKFFPFSPFINNMNGFSETYLSHWEFPKLKLLLVNQLTKNIEKDNHF